MTPWLNAFKQRLKVKTPLLFQALKLLYAPFRSVLPQAKISFFKIRAFMAFQMDRKRLKAYTLDHTIPVRYRIMDGRRGSKRPAAHINEELYTRILNEIRNGTFQYYGDTYAYLKQALREFPIAGKSVIVWGLEACNCDMISIHGGASKVYIVEYNPPHHDHPRVFPFSIAEFEKSGLQADAAISISSFEHDGLGRYGDPLHPDADLLAMQRAKRHLKEGGILYLAVPVGPDCLVYNAHRIYGKIRLPMLLEGFKRLASYGFDETYFDKPVTGSAACQPVFVLKNLETA